MCLQSELHQLNVRYALFHLQTECMLQTMFLIYGFTDTLPASISPAYLCLCHH